MALDKSQGVIEYETSLRTRQVSVTFDPAQISEEALIANIKKITRYTDVRIKQ